MRIDLATTVDIESAEWCYGCHRETRYQFNTFMLTEDGVSPFSVAAACVTCDLSEEMDA